MRVVRGSSILVVVAPKEGSVYVEDNGKAAHIMSLDRKKIMEALKNFPKETVEAVLRILDEETKTKRT